MAKYVPDIRTKRWVVVTPARISRPHDNTMTTDVVGQCVFDPGNEKLNPLELFRIAGQPGDPNWRVRVIANKFPITDLSEVIIHWPEHDKDVDTASEAEMGLVLQTYRQRFNYHMSQNNGQVIIFNNHDVHAGASIKHAHSQLVVVPSQINLDTLPRQPISNLVKDNKFFVLYCPDFSQWPYELWIAPKALGTTFGQIGDEEIADLAGLMKQSLSFLIKKFSAPDSLKQAVLPSARTDEVPYNYYIYQGTDWYLRIIPRLIHRAGFELGTGLSVNMVDPAQAAKEFREGLLNS